MKTYRLIRPCPRCPFRTDIAPYLTAARAQEIATDVASGATFYCHETTVLDESDEDGSRMTEDENSAACAGALILQEKMGQPNQMMRIAGRIGAYDPTTLDMNAPVYESWGDWQQSYLEEDLEPCGIVGPDCEAPAGYMVGGSIVYGTEAAEYECYCCGTPVCEACSTVVDGQRLCIDEAEEAYG